MIWLLLALGLLLRITSLTQSFWLDEAAQAVLSRTPIFNVQYAADFQPPLYYVFAHFWMQLGNIIQLGHTEWFLRLPSVFFGVSTIYVTYKIGAKLFSQKTGLLAAGFLSVAPFHIYYSQEFRMYSLLTLLCALCWYALNSKRWIFLSILVALSLFTHYFAFVNLVAMSLYLLHIKEKRGLGYLLSGILPFTLWIPTLVQQIATAHQLLSLWPKWSIVSSSGFFKFLPLLLAKWTVGVISPESRVIYAAAVTTIALLSGVAGIFFIKGMGDGNTTKKNGYALLLHYTVVSILIAWLAGIWLPAATPARIQFVLPAIYLIIAQGCNQIVGRKKYKPVLLIGIGIFCAIQLYFSTQYLLLAKYHREDWRGAIAYSDQFIESHPADEVVVLTVFDNKWAPMDWYSKYPEKYMGGNTHSSDKSNIFNNKIILYTYLFEIFDSNKAIDKNLSTSHNLLKEKDFQGVGILKVFIKK